MLFSSDILSYTGSTTITFAQQICMAMPLLSFSFLNCHHNCRYSDVLYKQSCWWKLTGDDVVAIAARVAVAGRQSSATLTSLGRWLHANVAVATDTELRSILAAHADFEVTISDGSFASALERYIAARIETMDRTAVAMTTDFFRRRRWLSTRVLDAVARKISRLRFVLCS